MRSSHEHFPITIAIASTDFVRWEQWEWMVRDGPRFRWMARTSFPQDVLPMVARHRPCVLMLDPVLCDDTGYPVWALSAWYPRTRVALLPAAADQEIRVLHALRNGASAYLSQETICRHLCDALCAVADGETWVPRKMLGSILDMSID